MATKTATATEVPKHARRFWKWACRMKKGNNIGPRWRKGQSGNPGGRPKRKLQSQAYKAELAKENKQGETNAELLAKRMVSDAINGSVRAAEHVANYVEGSPKQAFDMKLGIMDELADLIKQGRERAEKARRERPKS